MNTRVPKQIVDKNGKKTTVYVSVDKNGDMKMTRIAGLKFGAPSTFSGNYTAEELTAGTFDNKPWLTADGDRVSKVPIGSENDPYYTFAPQEAFAVSKSPLPSDGTYNFRNPYYRTDVPVGDFVPANGRIDSAWEGSKIRIGGPAGKVYRKTEDGDWINADPVGGVERVPSFWFRRKIDEGLNVELAPAYAVPEVVNEFEFDGVTVQHQYINNQTVRIEAEGEVAYWHTDGTNDILRERKGTLADVTIAIARFRNGEDPNADLSDGEI